MKSYVCIAATLALTWTALGDDITVVKTPPYNSSKVTGVDGLKLVFTTSTGSRISKELAEVELILITDQDQFNRAEKAYRDDGDYAEAVKSYTTALNQAGANETLKKLVVLRRLRALSRVGPVDQATRDWISVLSANGTAAASLAPQRMGAKGSAANANAIKALEAAAEKEKSKAAELAAIHQVLLKLYEIEGQKEKIDKLNSAGVTQKDVTSLNTADIATALRDAENQLRSNKPKEAYETIRRRINAFPASDLDRALMISARAQQAMAEAAEGEESKKLLAAAGLDYMRVAYFFGGSDDAGRALLLAGHCCRDLGNKAAARTTYKLVLEYYEGTEEARQAQTALDGL